MYMVKTYNTVSLYYRTFPLTLKIHTLQKLSELRDIFGSDEIWLTHCGLVTPYGVWILIKFDSGNGLLPDGINPLFEPILTCYQAKSHYLSQCWPSSLLPYGIIGLQWVKISWLYFASLNQIPILISAPVQCLITTDKLYIIQLRS